MAAAKCISRFTWVFFGGYGNLIACECLHINKTHILASFKLLDSGKAICVQRV